MIRLSNDSAEVAVLRAARARQGCAWRGNASGLWWAAVPARGGWALLEARTAAGLLERMAAL